MYKAKTLWWAGITVVVIAIAAAASPWVREEVRAGVSNIVTIGSLNINESTGQVTGVATPVNSTDGATKGYVDATVASSSGKVLTMQTFTTTSTWTRPTGTNVVWVTLCGGGGGGGGDDGLGGTGGGGGGAQCVYRYPVTVTTSMAVSVGHGGTLQVSGTQSSFGGAISAKGGGYGSAGYNGSNGNGGASGGGASGGCGGGQCYGSYNSTAGQSGTGDAFGNSGGGGAWAGGGGASGLGVGGGSGSYAGGNAGAYQGGAGGTAGIGGGGGPSGSGGNGIVIVEWWQ